MYTDNARNRLVRSYLWVGVRVSDATSSFSKPQTYLKLAYSLTFKFLYFSADVIQHSTLAKAGQKHLPPTSKDPKDETAHAADGDRVVGSYKASSYNPVCGWQQTHIWHRTVAVWTWLTNPNETTSIDYHGRCHDLWWLTHTANIMLQKWWTSPAQRFINY